MVLLGCQLPVTNTHQPPTEFFLLALKTHDSQIRRGGEGVSASSLASGENAEV